MDTTTAAPKLDTLPVGTLLLDVADGTTYRRAADSEIARSLSSEARNWTASGTDGASGTVSDVELRLLQYGLDRGLVAIIWQP